MTNNATPAPIRKRVCFCLVELARRAEAVNHDAVAELPVPVALELNAQLCGTDELESRLNRFRSVRISAALW